MGKKLQVVHLTLKGGDVSVFYGSIAAIYDDYLEEEIGIKYKSLCNYYTTLEKKVLEEHKDYLTDFIREHISEITYIYHNSKCTIEKGVLRPKRKGALTKNAMKKLHDDKLAAQRAKDANKQDKTNG